MLPFMRILESSKKDSLANQTVLYDNGSMRRLLPDCPFYFSLEIR